MSRAPCIPFALCYHLLHPLARLWYPLSGWVGQLFGTEALSRDGFLELWHLDISLSSQLDPLFTAYVTLVADQRLSEDLVRGQCLLFASVKSAKQSTLLD